MTERFIPEPKSIIHQGKEESDAIPATGVIVFDGDRFLAFEFAENSTVGKKWGIPGGHNEIDLETGELETGRKTGSREIREETDINTGFENLKTFDGNIFIKDMSENGSPYWVEWSVFYTHEFSGELNHNQPYEGKPEWKSIQEFFELPDEHVAPNAKHALLNALIHTANKKLQQND